MKKQAILIIAHNNVWTLEKIIRSLDSKYFDIFIHIDKKSNINNLDYIKSISKYSKVNIYKKYKVRWSGFSQVECELFLLNEANNFSDYSYFHLISGVDMPLKSAKKIYEFYEKNNGKEFVHFNSKKLPSYKYDWIKYYWFFRKFSRKSKLLYIFECFSIFLQKMFHVNRLRNSKLIFMTGANWFSITNDFCSYLLDHKNDFKKLFSNTRSSDEIFLQTLLYNSKFKDRLYYSDYDDNYISCMRFIDWKRGNPYVFKASDYDDLINSKFLFARKFDQDIDNKIIEKIYENNIKND